MKVTKCEKPPSPGPSLHLLALPAEIRLKIYELLIPHTISVDLCTSHEDNSAAPSLQRPQRSLAALRLRAYRLEHDIINRNGLYLLGVCRTTQAEIWKTLTSATVEVHCSKCFHAFVKDFSYGMGVGLRWMHNLKIYANPGKPSGTPGQNGFDNSLHKTQAALHAREVMDSCRELIRTWYGRLDLLEKERWTVEKLEDDVGLAGSEVEGGWLVRAQLDLEQGSN